MPCRRRSLLHDLHTAAASTSPHNTPATFSKSYPRPHFTRTTRTPAASNAPSTNPSRSFTFARWCDLSSNSTAAPLPLPPPAGEGRGEGSSPYPTSSSSYSPPASSSPPPIIATDHDPLALHAARKNAQAAGVDHLIKFIECDFRQTPIPQTPGHIILNPEYGERMGDATELEDTYAAIGDFFKQSCPGWTGHVFTGSPQLAKRIGLKPARKRPFMNGPIECRLLTFQLYTGSNREAAPQIAPKSLPPPPPIP